MPVLVVDRSDAVRSRLVSRLREAGLDVGGEASSLAEAFEVLTRFQPCAIVADVLLPDGRGPTIVAAFRSRAARAKIVVVTNATHYRDRCLAHGADHFLDKSAQFDDVSVVLGR